MTHKVLQPVGVEGFVVRLRTQEPSLAAGASVLQALIAHVLHAYSTTHGTLGGVTPNTGAYYIYVIYYVYTNV